MPAKRKLVYTTTIMASFARHDVALLDERYEVVSFIFAPKRKWATPFELLRQAFFLLRHLPGAAVSVTQFGGFHSFLPLSERIEALAVQLEQLVPLGVAQLYCYAEAFGYAAHQAVG
ncbi:MAG: hypothetical protein ACK6A5_08300, partial [Flavobacteriales bacterium]